MVSFSTSTADISILVGISVTICYLFLRQKRKDKLPPGPTRLPLLGNAHHLPALRPWLGLAELSMTYGDIMHVDMLGQSIVVISSRKAATDLMDKRSLIYSDRPVIPLIDMISMKNVFPLLPYGDAWRRQRRLVAQDFGTTFASNYHDLQHKEAWLLIRRIMKKPEDLAKDVKLFSGRLVIRVVYGYTVTSLDDPILAVGLKSLDNFDRAAQPGEFLVNMLPSLRYLPRWFPGAAFFKMADEYDALYRTSIMEPYNWCKRNLDTGITKLPNLCHNIWNKSPDASTDLEFATAAGSVFGGALDTGISLALTFFMNMILHPEVQRKAQAELDAVIGPDRLPNIGDQPDLPYIQSIVAETIRFMPPIPLCLPHATKEEDIYEGYYIPNSAWVIPNIWQMLHDPVEYPDPMAFNPDRFNGDKQAMESTKALAFGFGRRSCPGRLFAENSLFAIIATALATCDICPGCDKHGNEVLPSGRYESRTIVFPEAFPIKLEPRSAGFAALLAEDESP